MSANALRIVSTAFFAVHRSSLGAGPALEPRLLVAFGTERERFASAYQVHCYSGIAPVVQRSGRSELVRFRGGCNSFLRQSFHEWGACTIRFCPWARAYYDHLRAKNKDHHAVVRALAYKWIRILFRCWKDRTPYDEARYLECLRRRQALKPDLCAFRWDKTAGFHKFAGLGVSS